ncbi:MAG TPA: DMT family transporter [Bdellovibrionales bacterium]|nr:DMT family transporter [Bdellovibrionales bacterium]
MSLLVIAAAMVSIQAGAALAKQLFPVLGSQGTTIVRLAAAAIILSVIWRPWRTRLNKRQLGAIALYGATLGAMNSLFYMALERIPLGVAVAIEFVGPLGVALAGSRRAIDFVWALLAAAGILLILPVTALAAPLDTLGALYALGAGGFWAAYIVTGKIAGTAASSGAVTSIGMSVGALVAAPFALPFQFQALLTYPVWLLALGVAVFSSALPYSLEMIGLRNIPTKTFGILMSVEPAIAAVSGLLFLGEVLTLTQWTAIVLVMIASAGSAATAGGR